MKASPEIKVSDEEAGDALPNGTALFHGQYTIESFLSCGGFGVTYLARDSLERRVVIKECFPRASCRRDGMAVVPQPRVKDEDFRSIVRLFVDEARNLARLDHPNIVGVHQVFEDNQTAYMALDYVRGRELLEVIDEDALKEPEAVRKLLDTLLDTVEFIHGRGILHRDISPDNILIREDMSPVLIDFGAARADAMARDRRTAILAVKDGYSPQEFYIGGSQQDPSSDLYSLAATLHHVITGEPPLASSERLAEVAAKKPDPQPALAGAEGVAGYEARFLEAIDISLQVLQKNRFGSAAEWKAHLRGVVKAEGEESLAEVLVRRRKQIEDERAKLEDEADGPAPVKPKLKVVTGDGKVRSAPATGPRPERKTPTKPRVRKDQKRSSRPEPLAKTPRKPEASEVKTARPETEAKPIEAPQAKLSEAQKERAGHPASRRWRGCGTLCGGGGGLCLHDRSGHVRRG